MLCDLDFLLDGEGGSIFLQNKPYRLSSVSCDTLTLCLVPRDGRRVPGAASVGPRRLHPARHADAAHVRNRPRAARRKGTDPPVRPADEGRLPADETDEGRLSTDGTDEGRLCGRG